MSKELPFFKFYPSEWLTGDISDETDKIQGQFIAICAIYWSKNCDLTMDKLTRKVHKTKVKCLLNLGFISEKSGVVSIAFLDEQYAELSDLQRKRSEAGSKGRRAQLGQTPDKSESEPGHLEVDKEVELEVDKETAIAKQIKIPTLTEFLDYSRGLCEETGKNYKDMIFVFESKYQTWKDDGWKDGHGNPIKVWKNKLRNTLPHLKPINQQHGKGDRRDGFAENDQILQQRIDAARD